MMNDALTSLAYNLKPGTTIKGKWNGNTYTLRKQLGKGANGIVYLAEASDGHVALKVSDDSLSITSEVNVLKSFSKAQSVTMGPSFFDTDDAYIQCQYESLVLCNGIHKRPAAIELCQ